MHGLVSHLNMQRLGICVRIDRNRFDSHFTGGFDDAAGDFAPVGDQKLFEHGASLVLGVTRKTPPRRDARRRCDNFKFSDATRVR